MSEQATERGLPTLRAWRLAYGYSQVDLAELAGVRQATIADLERGLYAPRPSTVRKLAQALGISPLRLQTSYPTSPTQDAAHNAAHNATHRAQQKRLGDTEVNRV